MRIFLMLTLVLGCLRGYAQDLLMVQDLVIRGKYERAYGENALFITNGGDSIIMRQGDYRLVYNDLNMVVMPKSTRKMIVTGSFEKQSVAPELVSPYTRVFGQIDMGITIRNGIETLVKPAVSGAVGYRFFEQLSVGGGVGFDPFEDMNLIPVFGRVSGTLARQTVSPFYQFSMGHSIAKIKQEAEFEGEIDPSADGGLRVHPEIGLKFRDKVSTTFAFGMLSQRLSKTTGFVDWRGNPNLTTENMKLNMVTIRLGFEF